MQVNQADLEAVWREAWIDAPEGALTFSEKLTEKWRDARSLNEGGSLSNLSKSSSSHGYAQPHSDHRILVQMERICLAAIKLYEQIAADLDDTDETAIYNEGIARFKVVTSEVYPDLSSARCSIA